MSDKRSDFERVGGNVKKRVAVRGGWFVTVAVAFVRLGDIEP